MMGRRIEIHSCSSRLLHWLAYGLFFFGILGGGWALEYPKNKDLAKQLKAIAASQRKAVRVESLLKTQNKNELWFVELGAGKDEERKRRPALLLVAGIEGNDLAGTVSALAWLESLAKKYADDEKIRKLLDTTTLYIFPRLNPDGADSFFAKPKRETSVNSRPVDDDNDGLADEDGPEDLNNDGLITWMRVEDPGGEYILDPVEPRLLIKADKAKGEQGAWRYLSEGRDNDKDEAWNEDGPGGINFNRNFPFNYKFFAPWAGRHQMSEAETRALADFIVTHPNIAIVFTFGAADNLIQTPKGEAPKRPPTAIHEEDVPFYRELGKSWRETLGLKKELSAASEPGTFSDWMYYHRGRLSLAARAWTSALQVELAKSKSDKEADKPKEDKKAKEQTAQAKKDDKPAATDKSADKTPKKAETDTRNEEERAFLKWVDENAPEAFVPWQSFDHPDFPGKKVEIGGFAPFARTNPPTRLLEDLAQKHSRFLTELLGKLPRIGIRKAEAKHLGNSIYDVRVQVENSGYLPTSLAQGNVTREVHPTRVVLHADDKSILSGTRTTMLGAIEGSGGIKEVRWIVHAGTRTKLEIEVISMLAGSAETSIDLKQ